MNTSHRLVLLRIQTPDVLRPFRVLSMDDELDTAELNTEIRTHHILASAPST
jgi:hypothetical protein